MTISVAVVDDQGLMRDAYTMILNVQERFHKRLLKKWVQVRFLQQEKSPRSQLLDLE